MEPEYPQEQLVENLSAYAHEAWCGWMTYLFAQSATLNDGTVCIPPNFAERWKRQADTRYEDLPENEKQSDRVEAKKMLEIIQNWEING